MEIKLNVDESKPNLLKVMHENPALAKEVIGTFVQLMEESFSPDKGISWSELPKKLHKELTFQALIRGVLRGALDVQAMNPEAYDALQVEVHPLAMLSPRKNYLSGGMTVYNWRDHFKMPADTQVSEETVAQLIRKTLRYARYIKMEELHNALEYNQIATYRGMGDDQIAKLPMYPALRYQLKIGALHVGKFFDDIGFLDCGTYEIGIDEDPICQACGHEGVQDIGKYQVCLNCNAGYRKEESNG